MTDEEYLRKVLNRCNCVDGCLICPGALATDGYPVCYRNGNSNLKIHRFVWSVFNRTFIEKGLVIRHNCDNILCINPSHLQIGTVKDNNDDIRKRGRKFKLLSPEQVRDTKFLLELGLPHSNIGEIVGLNPRRVSEIKCGKRDENGYLVKKDTL